MCVCVSVVCVCVCVCVRCVCACADAQLTHPLQYVRVVGAERVEVAEGGVVHGVGSVPPRHRDVA